MSNFIQSKTGAINTRMVDPKTCEGTDIPELQRSRESWSLDKVAELQESIKKFGVQVPAIGYMDGDVTRIVKGHQRMHIVQAFQANKERINVQGTGDGKGEAPMLPVTYVAKPKTKDDIVNMLLSMVDENNVRYGDDALTLYQTFKILRDQGLTLMEIGERCSFSHAKVDYYLRAFSSKPLADAVIKGDIDVKAAADITRSKAVQVKDPKTNKVKLDDAKVKDAIKEAKQAAQAAGKTKQKLNIKDVKESKPESNTRDAGEIKRILKTVADLPTESDLLPEIRWFAKWLLTKMSVDALKKGMKTNKLDLEGLLELIESGAFEVKKAAKKSEKAATKKAASKASKKANPNVEEDEEEELDAEEYGE